MKKLGEGGSKRGSGNYESRDVLEQSSKITERELTFLPPVNAVGTYIRILEYIRMLCGSIY